MKVAGFGFRAQASLASLQDALSQSGIAIAELTAIATPDDKADAPVIIALAKALALPIHPVESEALQRQRTSTQSTRIADLRGTGSVAEAAALAAAAPNARLEVARCISQDRLATVAIAISGETR